MKSKMMKSKMMMIMIKETTTMTPKHKERMCSVQQLKKKRRALPAAIASLVRCNGK